MEYPLKKYGPIKKIWLHRHEEKIKFLKSETLRYFKNGLKKGKGKIKEKM